MKHIGASLIPILALCLAACTSFESDPASERTCGARNAALHREVSEYVGAHPPQDPRISLLRPYPPVIEPQGVRESHTLTVQGNRDSAPSYFTGLEGEILWIPPVGFDPVTGRVSPAPVMDTAFNGVETSMPVIKPVDMSLVQIVSAGGYAAKVRIFDSANRLVHESTQDFGYRGELMNLSRVVPTGLVSYLVWNSREGNGVLVADGAYLWRVVLKFNDGTEYEATVKTGFFNTACPVE